MKKKINFMDLQLQYKDHVDSITNGLKSLIKEASFVGGAPLSKFEASCSNYFNSFNAIGVGSGLDALILSLKACNIGPGQSVIVPANTFIATAFAISHVGADVIFVDVDPDTYNIDINKAEKALRPNTCCIMPVHLYGQACNMDAVMEFSRKYRLIVIEDCAQAIGAKYKNIKVGTIGDFGCYSFYPAKNLGGLGQGGLVLTPNSDMATSIREKANVGRKMDSHFDFTHIGYNSRLDTLNAYFIDYFLNYIDIWNSRRQHIAELYFDNLLIREPILKLPFTAPNCTHVYHLFELKCATSSMRTALIKHLSENGIATGLHYPIPCNKQPVYADLKQECPIAEDLAGRLLSLPMHPFLADEDVLYICNTIKEFKY